MSGLRTRTCELSEPELLNMLQKAMAVLAGVAHLLVDQAIALSMHNQITKTSQVHTELSALAVGSLRQLQSLLPRVTAEISQSWVDWTMATHDNWLWLAHRCADLEQSYEKRFQESPFRKEFRELYRRSPRPRQPGRTPFPNEPC